jgi:NHL repeat
MGGPVPMTPRVRSAVMAFVIGLASSGVWAQPNPYNTLTDWLDAGDSSLGSVSAVYPDASDNVWIAERCGENSCVEHPDSAPLRLLSAAGRPLRSIGAGLFAWPHGLFVAADGNLWVTDGRAGAGKGHQVLELTPSGNVLLRLGEAGIAGADTEHFDGPTAVLIAPNGAIFVADGHEPDSNNRIVKFAADGTFLATWGHSGSAPGEFRVPHALAMDSRGRLFVADRDNNRIQIFDQEGHFLAEWTQFGRPSGLYIGAGDMLYVSDNQSNDARNRGWPRGIRIGSAKDGVVLAFIPDPEFDPANAEEKGAHGIAVDSAGAVYGAEVWSQTVNKYVPASAPPE